MNESIGHRTGVPMMSRDRTHTLFARTMGHVAVTAAVFALGAYLGRDAGGGAALVGFLGSFGSLIAMRFAAARSLALTVGLLLLFGLLLGVAIGPTLGQYADADPRALWRAGAATALFVAGFGAAGYGTRRDLAVVARVSSWALVGLIVFGIVLLFVGIPGGALVYSVLGLVIFAGFIMVDFQRLRTGEETETAPFLAASIFLDILNVFLFFLTLFSGRSND